MMRWVDKLKAKAFIILSSILIMSFNIGALAATDTDFTQWDVEEWGGLSGNIVHDGAEISGTYDGGTTCPGTGGFNSYILSSDIVLTGYAMFSIDMTVNSCSGTEFGFGIGLRECAASPPTPYADSITFCQYYYGSTNSIGRVWIDSNATAIYVDNSDITTYNARTYSMEYDDGEVSFYIDGVLKGAIPYSFTNYQAFVQVSIKYSGANASVTFDEPIIEQQSSNPSSDNPSSVDSSQLMIDAILIISAVIVAVVVISVIVNLRTIQTTRPIARSKEIDNYPLKTNQDLIGTPSEPIPTDKVMVGFCYHCGKPNEGRRFCIHCGQKLIK